MTIGVYPPKPMKHVAYSPYFSKIYNPLFLLLSAFLASPTLTKKHLRITLYTYWTPLYMIWMQYILFGIQTEQEHKLSMKISEEFFVNNKVHQAKLSSPSPWLLHSM